MPIFAQHHLDTDEMRRVREFLLVLTDPKRLVTFGRRKKGVWGSRSVHVEFQRDWLKKSGWLFSWREKAVAFCCRPSVLSKQPTAEREMTAKESLLTIKCVPVFSGFQYPLRNLPRRNARGFPGLREGAGIEDGSCRPGGLPAPE